MFLLINFGIWVSGQEKSYMLIIRRVALSLIVFAIAAVVLEWFLGELAVNYEMRATGAKECAEVANDFGLGLLGMLVVLPLTFIGSLISSVFAWRLTGK